MKIVMDRHTDGQTLNLTSPFAVGMELLRVTHRLMKVNTCAKLFKNPSIDCELMAETRNTNGI